MTKDTIKSINGKNRYVITMMNSNGYTIKRKFNTIAGCVKFANFYPLNSFFAWIYDSVSDSMVKQNCYSGKFKNCNNETFIPYYC